MARGGVTKLAQRAGSVLVALLFAAAEAAAEDAASTPRPTAGRAPLTRSAPAIALLRPGAALGRAGDLADALPSGGQTPWSLRLSHPPVHGQEIVASRPEWQSGAPLYGVLAGRALLSALHAREALPARMTPWFDGDADRVLAGFELSF